MPSRPKALQYSDSAFPTLQAAPSVRGEIRRRPEDFFVAELPEFPLAGAGEHLYLLVEKRGVNTGWLAHRIAAWLGLEDRDVGFAGRKDRHAVTRQWFSCYLPGSGDVDWSAFHIDGVRILETGRHKAKLRRGRLAGNRFDILVRHGRLAADRQAELAARLERLAREGFPNYFGYQRFGHDGRNLEAADRLLRCGETGQRNREMLVSAARAWLFNLYLREALSASRPLAGCVGPLIGKSRDPQPGEALMDEMELAWVAGLRKLGARAGARPLLAMPGDLQWSFTDSGVRLSFSLPAGCYATSLLREVYLVEDAAPRVREEAA